MTKQRTVADIIDDVSAGRIGHREAIERLGLDSYPELLDTMRANGRSLWAHRAGARGIDKATLEVLRLACRRTDENDRPLGPPSDPL